MPNLDLIGLIEILSTALGEDTTLKVKPGHVWRYDYERNLLEFPKDLTQRCSLEETVGFILHEIGHRQITRIDPRKEPFLQLFSKNYLKLLFHVFEDIRTNEWVISLYPGAIFYLEQIYNQLLSEDLTKTEYINHLQRQIKKDIHPYVFYPHVEYLLGVLYLWRFKKFPPLLLNPEVKKALEETHPFFEAIFSCYPKGWVGEKEKFALTLKTAQLITTHILPVYERLVDTAQERIKEQLAPNVQTETTQQMVQGLIEQGAQALAEDLRPKIETQDMQEQWSFTPSPKGIKQPLRKSLKGLSLRNLIRIQKDLTSTTPSLYQRFYPEISSLIQHLYGVLENCLVQNRKHCYIGYFQSGQRPDLRKAMNQTRKLDQNIPLERSDLEIFLRRRLPTEREHYIALVLDESGSMVEPKRSAALKALLLFMETLSQLKINYALVGFADTVVVHKELTTELNPRQRAELFAEISMYIPAGLTADADALALTTGLLENTPNDALRLIIMITDGEGNVNNTGKSFAILQEEAENKDIEVIGIGIGGFITDVKRRYKNAIQIERLEELPQALGHLLEKKIEEFYLA